MQTNYKVYLLFIARSAFVILPPKSAKTILSWGKRRYNNYDPPRFPASQVKDIFFDFLDFHFFFVPKSLLSLAKTFRVLGNSEFFFGNPGPHVVRSSSLIRQESGREF